MIRPEMQALAHPDKSVAQPGVYEGVSKERQVCSQFWLLVYALVVAALSAGAFVFFTQRYGVTEERDRAFFLSIILASEISYWLSKWCRGQRPLDGRSGYSLLWVERACLLLVVLCGSSAFLITSPDPKIGVACFLALSLLQWVFHRLSRLRLMEILEVPAALMVVGCSFWLMVLASYKDVHHWSYFLGPVYTVLDGGHLLWDVPSQYGFLNIFSVVTLSRVSGLNPEITMCHLLVLLEALGFCLTCYLFRFRLGLSTLVSASVAATFHFCLPGWIEMYSGPAYIPSSSAFRFFPSIAALLSFAKVVHHPSRAWLIFSGVLIAISSLWSAESCLYAGAPILTFLFFDFFRKPRLAFFVSPAIQVCVGAGVLAGGGIGLYALSLPHGIDLHAFYEYAEAYATFSGTLPMEADLWTGLFVFLLSISYLTARLSFKEGGNHAAHGPMIFVYVVCIATYFVARSNYRNVHNIIPWALTALATIVAAPESVIRHIQKTLVLTLGALSMGFFIAYYSQGHNPNRITDRYKGLHVYVPLEFETLTPGVAQAAREAVGSSAFTVINDRALFAQTPELGSYGHALPISPLMHFFLLGDARCRLYTQRMVERVPRSYVLCQDRICPGIPYVFEKMKDLVEVKPVPFPFGKSLGWEIVEITKR